MGFDTVPAMAPEMPQQTPDAGGTTPQQPPQDDKFATKFAALSRKEKEIRLRDQQAQERMKSLQEHESKVKEYEEWKKQQEEVRRLKEADPLAWLEKEGLNYEKLTDHVVNRDEYTKDSEYRSLKKDFVGMRDYIQELKEEIKGLKEGRQKEVEETQKAQNERAYREWISSVEKTIQENSEEFELVSNYGSVDVIGEMQMEYMKEHGKPAELKQLLQAYENYLEKQTDEEYNRMKGLKKFKKHLPPEDILGEDEAQTDSPQILPSRQNVHRTLNNSFNFATPPKENRPLNSEESLREAARLIRFTND